MLRSRVALRLAAAAALLLPMGAAVASSPPTRTPVAQLKIMNYYPADAGWTRMWSSYSHSRTAADFAAIAALGANTVRIVVQPSATGFPTPTTRARENLADVLDTARQQRLGVQLTLFDWWHDYADVQGSRQWLNSLLADSAGDPVVSLVELQNEIPTTSPAALAWAQALLPDLDRLLPGVPRALSASSSSGLPGITAVSTLPASLLEIVSVHYYGEPAYAAGLLAAAKAVAQRPVIVGEAGRSTVDGGGADEAQARFFRTMGAVTRNLGLPPAAPWTLTDFTSTGVPAGSRLAERYFGLRRTNGTWKPAAAVVRDVFAGRLLSDIDGSFERERSTSTGVTGSWAAFDAADGTGVVTASTRRTGAVSVCFSGTKSSPGRVPSVVQSFPVLRAAQQTTASSWVLRRRATGAERISLAYYDLAGRYLRQVESASARAQGRWEQLTVQGVAPVGAAVVQVHLKAGNESGQACYDDVVVR